MRVTLPLFVLLGMSFAAARAHAGEPGAVYCEALVAELEGADREDARARCADVLAGLPGGNASLDRALSRLAGLDGFLRLRTRTPAADATPAALEVLRSLAAQRALLARIYPHGPAAVAREPSTRRVPVEKYCAQRVQPLPPSEHSEGLLRCRDVAGELADALRGPRLAADLDRLAALDGWLHARAAAPVLLPEDPRLRAQAEALADAAWKSSRDEGEMLSRMYPQQAASARAQGAVLDPFATPRSVAVVRKPAPQPVEPVRRPRAERHDLMDPFESAR